MIPRSLIGDADSKRVSAAHASVLSSTGASTVLDLFRPFISPRSVELAAQRVMTGDFRIVRRTRKGGKEVIERAEGSDAELKIALLLVRQFNPDEHLSSDEEALLRGVTRKTVGAMRARGD